MAIKALIVDQKSHNDAFRRMHGGEMRTDEDLLIEPHPFRNEVFNTNNPVVAEILNNGKEIKNDAA